MKRVSRWLCLALVLCLLGGMLPFALAESPEPAEEMAATEEATLEPEPAPGEAHGPEAPAQWTVLIYLCGTDLESEGGMASQNLRMIAGTQPDDAVNVLIQTGGTSGWQAEAEVGIDIAADQLQRWRWDGDGYALVDEQELASMAKYTTLGDFIQWGAGNYPAEKLMLILWDHGGGSASGLIADELHDKAMMSLEGLSRALKRGGAHFDLLMTDACLMASLETAQAVAPYADYLLASEEAVPGRGTNYQDWLQSLYDEPDCGPVRLGRNVCDATEIMYAESYNDIDSRSLTFSLIDLGNIDAVADAFNDYMREATGLISDPVAFGDYLAVVNGADRFMVSEMWDLYDLARRGMKGGISKQTGIRLENAVDEAVLYNVRQAYHPYAHGLSVFLSYSDRNGMLDHLARSCANPWQLAFLDAVNLKWDAPEWVTDIVGDIPQLKNELYTIKFDAGLDGDQGQPILNLLSGTDSGSYIRYELQRYSEQDQSWYNLGESEDLRLIGLTDEKASFAACFTGKWPAIDGEFLSIRSKELLGNMVLLQAPIRFVGRDFNLRILAVYPQELFYDPEESAEEPAEDTAPAEPDGIAYEVSYEVEGIWDGFDSSTGLVNRNTWSVTDLLGLTIDIGRPVYSDYLEDIGDMKFSESIPITLELAVEDTVLPEGQYRLRFTISDMLDRTYYTDFFNLTWDGAHAVFADPEAEESDDLEAGEPDGTEAEAPADPEAA